MLISYTLQKYGLISNGKAFDDTMYEYEMNHDIYNYTVVILVSSNRFTYICDLHRLHESNMFVCLKFVCSNTYLNNIIHIVHRYVPHIHLKITSELQQIRNRIPSNQMNLLISFSSSIIYYLLPSSNISYIIELIEQNARWRPHSRIKYKCALEKNNANYTRELWAILSRKVESLIVCSIWRGKRKVVRSVNCLPTIGRL